MNLTVNRHFILGKLVALYFTETRNGSPVCYVTIATYSVKKVSPSANASQEGGWSPNKESIPEYHKVVVYNVDLIEQLRNAKKSSYVLVVGPTKSVSQKRQGEESQPSSEDSDSRSTITITKFTGSMIFLNTDEETVGNLNYVHLIGHVSQEAQEVSHPEFGNCLQFSIETKTPMTLADGQSYEKKSKHQILIINHRLFSLKPRFSLGVLVYVNGLLSDDTVVIGDSYMNGQVIIMTTQEKRDSHDNSNRESYNQNYRQSQKRSNSYSGGRFLNEDSHSSEEKNPLIDFFQ